MPRFLWPGFQFGAPTAPSSVTTAATPTTTDPWTKLVRFAEVWGHSKQTQLFPRFERVFPNVTPVGTTPALGSLITLTYHIVTEFPFIIATDAKVLISSDVTVVA